MPKKYRRPATPKKEYDDDLDHLLDGAGQTDEPDPFTQGPRQAASFLRKVADTNTRDLGQEIAELLIEHVLPFASTLAELPEADRRAAISIFVSRIHDALLPVQEAVNYLGHEYRAKLKRSDQTQENH